MKVHDVSCQKGAVLHVAGEDEIGLRQRVEAFCRRHEVEDPSYAILPGRLDLADDASVDALIADIKAAKAERGEPVVLVIVDTLARCASIDENSSRDMGEVVTACDRIRRETGAAVLIIHHSGKEAKKGARGSSALRAAVDSEIQVQSKDGGRGALGDEAAKRAGAVRLAVQAGGDRGLARWRERPSESACTVEHLERTEGKLNFGKSHGQAQAARAEPEEAARCPGDRSIATASTSWDDVKDSVSSPATTFPGAARSTIHSAIEGMTKHGVLTQPAMAGSSWSSRRSVRLSQPERRRLRPSQ